MLTKWASISTIRYCAYSRLLSLC